MPHVPRISSLLILLALVTTGCGEAHDASVTGTVSLDGQPLTKGAVTFTPVQAGAMAVANIQPDGSYSVYTGDQAGLEAGEYRVTVAATEMPAATPEDPEPLPKLLTPARYSDPSTSGLTLKVTPGSNRFDISLDNK